MKEFKPLTDLGYHHKKWLFGWHLFIKETNVDETTTMKEVIEFRKEGVGKTISYNGVENNFSIIAYAELEAINEVLSNF